MNLPRWLVCFFSLSTSMFMAAIAYGQNQPGNSNSITNSTAGSTTNDVLLIDSLGRLVAVPTNQVPSAIRPPPTAVNEQIPTFARGSLAPAAILQRARDAITNATFFPSVPPTLMPYLASQDDYGNTALAPGPLFPWFPSEPWIDGAKSQLSKIGLRYSLQQTFTYVSLSNVKNGTADNLAEYTFDLKSKWAIYDVPATAAGWLSSQVQAKSGLGSPADSQSAKSNLGTLTSPTVAWSGTNTFRMPELAWQQSVLSGHVVAVLGMVSQRLYMDDNAYANSGRSKFMNSALINSQVLPLGRFNFGFNLQWQPRDEWYAMVGGNAGNATAGLLPWINFNWNTWSLPVEIGYAPHDVFGLGPGIYRIQPFAAGAHGTTGGGFCFNAQQKLGPDSPFGWFGRFGFGNSKVSNTADNEIGTGFVAQGPFKHLLFKRTSNDFLGTGFVWSQPAATTKTVFHENEYVWETVYVIQLTPTIKLMPDFQMIWDPVFHNTNHASVFQLQLAMAW